jgi:uncharacterized membrane protein YtjA (UPF0391 family)
MGRVERPNRGQESTAKPGQRRAPSAASYAMSFAGPTVPRYRCRQSVGKRNRGGAMLHYAVVFFIIALIAAVFGFTGLAAGAAGIAKILFVLFLIGAAITFLMSLAHRT